MDRVRNSSTPSSKSTVVAGISTGSGSSGVDPQYPYVVNGTAIFIDRGAAADIWLIETLESKYIIKILRLNLEYMSTSQSRNTSHEGTNQPDDPAQRFTQSFHLKARSWTSLQHRNIIKVFGLGERLDLRVELCENGTARKYLERYNDDIDSKKLIIQHVLEGMNYLHSQNPPIVHGCLRADKIFVSADGTAKVGEFGLSFLTRDFALHAPSISQADTGTVVPTTASDVWALACTLLEVISGEVPYNKHKHELRVRRAIIRGEKPGTVGPSQSEDFSSIFSILEQCWEMSPNSRPLVSEMQQAFQLNVGPLATDDTTDQEAAVGHRQIVTTHKKLSPESKSLPRPSTIANLERAIADRERRISYLQNLIRAQTDQSGIFTPEESKDSFPDPDHTGETPAHPTESLDDFARQLELYDETWSVREEEKWRSQDENHPTSSNLPPRSLSPTVDPVPASDPVPDLELDLTAPTTSLSFPQRPTNSGSTNRLQSARSVNNFLLGTDHRPSVDQ
ncbi:hypothetical protein FRC12_011402 [Ceratobasidium sp. 428]|nr:hypothetical protein FRC12_011402 [Ceratobasidium sp. 428]